MTTLGNQLANDTVRMKQVERQIADPLAVEGSVEYHYNLHGLDFKSPVTAERPDGVPHR